MEDLGRGPAGPGAGWDAGEGRHGDHGAEHHGNQPPGWRLGFLDNFYNMDVLGGTLVSDQAFQASWNVAAAASATAAVACIPTWETDFREDLARIDVPVLVVQGDADRILPYPDTGKRLPGLSQDMELVVIQGGPHAIAWTHADRVNQALLGCLK